MPAGGFVDQIASEKATVKRAAKLFSILRTPKFTDQSAEVQGADGGSCELISAGRSSI